MQRETDSAGGSAASATSLSAGRPGIVVDLCHNGLREESHNMQERKGAVTLRGNPMTLVGPELKAGDKAPDFTVIANDMKPVTLSDTAGKVRIIASVPSL